MIPTPSSTETTEIKKSTTTAVRCKVCGYITDPAKVKDVCPACGVKATMFEPLNEKFSDGRRRYLDLHIHPVIVHFPQAFSVALLVLSVLALLPGGGTWRQALTDMIMVLAAVLPVTVIASFISGLIDGRVRFKKLSTPFLRIKITVGITYMVASSGYCAIVFLVCPATQLSAAIAAFVALGLVACTSILGYIGAAISYARMPG